MIKELAGTPFWIYPNKFYQLQSQIHTPRHRMCVDVKGLLLDCSSTSLPEQIISKCQQNKQHMLRFWHSKNTPPQMHTHVKYSIFLQNALTYFAFPKQEHKQKFRSFYKCISVSRCKSDFTALCMKECGKSYTNAANTLLASGIAAVDYLISRSEYKDISCKKKVAHYCSSNFISFFTKSPAKII